MGLFSKFKKTKDNIKEKDKPVEKRQLKLGDVAIPGVDYIPMTKDEDDFVVAVYHSIRNYGFDRPLTHERLKDHTIVFRYPELATFPIGRIKLRGKTKMQIFVQYDNYWVEGKTFEEYCELTEEWAKYLNDIVKYDLGNVDIWHDL